MLMLTTTLGCLAVTLHTDMLAPVFQRTPSQSPQCQGMLQSVVKPLY